MLEVCVLDHESRPGNLAGLVPKGAHDCGNHEWYRADEGTWRCYHCRLGETGSSPWTSEEHLQYALGGIDATLRGLALGDAPRREPQVAELLRLIREVRDLLPEQMKRLEQLEKLPTPICRRSSRFFRTAESTSRVGVRTPLGDVPENAGR